MPRLNVCIDESEFVVKEFGRLELGEIFVKLSQAHKANPCPHIKVEEYRHNGPTSHNVYQAVSLRSACGIYAHSKELCIVVDATLSLSFRRA